MTLTNKNIIVKIIRSSLAISDIDRMPKELVFDKGDFVDENEYFEFLEWLQENNIEKK